MSTDLAEFLRARIAEDEAMAQGTTPVDVPGRWIPTRDKYGDDDGPLKFIQGETPWTHEPNADPLDYIAGNRLIVVGVEWQDRTEGNLHHIARHDPARVLAECDAKRRIIECAHEALTEHQIGTAKWLRVLRSLALPYADHPEYRSEWGV